MKAIGVARTYSDEHVYGLLTFRESSDTRALTVGRTIPLENDCVSIWGEDTLRVYCGKYISIQLIPNLRWQPQKGKDVGFYLV